jgi:polyferredoxin
MGEFLSWKLFRGNLAPLYESYIELAAFLAILLLAAAATAVRTRRQTVRRLVQAASLLVFFFVVSSCLGVFGLIRNFYFGLTELGKDDLRAFYYMGLASVVYGLAFATGPIFCGWICPTGTLQEWLGAVRTSRRRLEGPHTSLPASPGEVSGPSPAGRAWVVGITLALFAAFMVVVGRVFSSRRPMLEDSAVLWAGALIVVSLFVVMRPDADRALKGLRYLSLALIIAFCVAGVTVTSPVHFVFTNVHDWASLLSTVAIMGAALLVSRSWCRYLCPLGALLGTINRCSLTRIERRPHCTDCGACDDVCTTAAISRGHIDLPACTMCLACVDTCPHQALVLTRAGEPLAADPGGSRRLHLPPPACATSAGTPRTTYRRARRRP